MNGREGGFITMINSCKKSVWTKFHLRFKIFTKFREHYNNVLVSGPPGSGKTYGIITDKGFVRALYLFPNHNLRQRKAEEFGVDTDVYHNLIEDLAALDVPDDKRDSSIAWRKKKVNKYLSKYNVLVFDEVSMLTEHIRNIIFTRFPQCKIYFIGDIGYQIGPTHGAVINKSAFQHEEVLTDMKRCKDEYLKVILQNMRNAIDIGKYNVKKLISGLHTITLRELQKKYKVKDMILNYSNKEKDIYTKMFSHMKKYYITKCNNDHEFNTGEIYYEKPDYNHCELRHGYTTHSVQGDTFYDKIYINRDVLNNLQVLYTAISRAEYLHQIYIITDN